MRVEGAIEYLREIRDAQLDFRQINLRYGNLNELVSAGMINEELVDGEDDGFIYSLQADRDHYILIIIDAKPEIGNQNERLSLYLDETGNARASFDPKLTADANSEPIRPKAWGPAKQ